MALDRPRLQPGPDTTPSSTTSFGTDPCNDGNERAGFPVEQEESWGCHCRRVRARHSPTGSRSPAWWPCASLIVGCSSRRVERRSVADASPTSPAPRSVPAARKYTDIGWLPASLLVPERLPPEAHLPLRYKVPYYAVGKLGWLLYGRAPVDPALPWSPDSRWTALFDSSVPAWGPPAADETFVRLRLQGPNPFMLTKVEPVSDAG